MVAKYVFLTCAVSVVERGGFPAVLPKLHSISQYDPQFMLSNSRIIFC